jgi:lysylphosphatidylglycerol synthetase-like protein (DUF2156 family)
LNRNSYTYLIPVVIGFVLVTALLLGWVLIVWPSVHFKPMAEKICLISSPVLAIAWLLHLWHTRKGEWQRKKALERLKVFLGAFVASAVVMVSLLAAVIFLTSRTFSSYDTAYEYAGRGHRSCTGIHVFDTEVNKQIKICEAGSGAYQGWVRVEKRSGPLGFVVIGAVPI